MKPMIFFMCCLHFLFVSKGREKKTLFDDFDHTMIVAHRGLTSVHLENTLESLVAAFEDANADGVEFDVQMSKDQVPMVFHDAELDRMIKNVSGKITDYKAQELSQMMQTHERYAQEYAIPTLAQVLEKMPANKLINIELKETTLLFGEEGMKNVLKEIEPYKNSLRIVISSFEPKILSMVSKLDQDYALGFLIDRKNTLLAYMRATSMVKNVDYIHPHIDLVDQQTSKWLKEKDVKLIFWGHKNLDQARHLIADQHTALITDIAEQFKQ